jgi:amidophosphoribosyltransferase
MNFSMNCDKLREKCAVFGVSIDDNSAAELTYNALLTMQHRGQEGAGIAVVNDKTIICKKGIGLAMEVFKDGSINRMQSGIAVGHCLCFAVSDLNDDVQPSVTEYLTGRIAAVLNCRITNVRALRGELMTYGLTFTGTSDGEVLSKLLAYHCMINESVLEGVKYAATILEGCFSMLVMSTGKENNKLIAVRDSSGFRPFCIGSNAQGIAVASESCALDICGFDFVRDIRPGEVVQIEDGKITYEEVILMQKIKNTGLCAFEYVYLARPDSCIDNLSVYEARVNMGRILARENKIEADAVCGVPDSGLEAALGYSLESGIPLVPGFMCNRYIGRSFIYPTQSLRENAVKLKLNPLKLNVENRRIILVDDTIVRGTSTRQVVRELKNVGAREVHMLVSSPPIKFKCGFGCVDTANAEQLIANNKSLDEIRETIGADSLNYISINGLKQACSKCTIPQCMQCFSTV